MRVLLFCLLLAGCGGKPDGPAVRISTVGAGLQTQYVPMLLAQALGYYREEGVAVTFENLASIEKAMQAMIGGSVDVAASSYSQILLVSAEGQRVRTFFVGLRRNSFVLVVAPAAEGRIRRAEDLKGAVIGTVGATGLPFLHHYLGAHGLRPGEFSTVTIGVGMPAIAAVESGRLDAANVAGGDHIRLLRRHPSLRILVDSSTPEGMRETFGSEAYSAGVLSAKQSWLDANPDTARRVARATRRGLQWMAAHSFEESREKLPEAFRSEDAALDVDVLRWARDGYTKDGRMPAGSPEAWKRLLGTVSERVRDAKIDLAATWTDEYLSESK